MEFNVNLLLDVSVLERHWEFFPQSLAPSNVESSVIAATVFRLIFVSEVSLVILKPDFEHGSSVLICQIQPRSGKDSEWKWAGSPRFSLRWVRSDESRDVTPTSRLSVKFLHIDIYYRWFDCCGYPRCGSFHQNGISSMPMWSESCLPTKLRISINRTTQCAIAAELLHLRIKA